MKKIHKIIHIYGREDNTNLNVVHAVKTNYIFGQVKETMLYRNIGEKNISELLIPEIITFWFTDVRKFSSRRR